MPKSIGGWLAFAFSATAVFVIGLAIYSRVKRQLPTIARLVEGAE